MRLTLLLMVFLLTALSHEDRWRKQAARVRRALQLAEITEAEAQETMGVTQPRFSKQLAGVEHLSLQRLGRLPDRFQRWYGFLLVVEYGLPEEVTRGLDVERAITHQKRMAIMTLPQPQKESA